MSDQSMADVQARLKALYPWVPDQLPSLGRIVHYRGRLGLQTLRAAIVTADIESLDPRGVESGDVPALDDELHVHLWVWTPAQAGPNAAAGGFAEFNVGYGLGPGEWCWPERR